MAIAIAVPSGLKGRQTLEFLIVKEKCMKKIIAIVGGLTIATGMAFAGEGQKKSFNEIDQNQDGVVTQTEASENQDLVAKFSDADTNQDGYLTPSEYESIQTEMEEAE